MVGLSAVPSVDLARGSCTFSVCATMYVEATIRMTSNTSTTSTSGVTLICAIVRTRPRPPAIVPAIYASTPATRPTCSRGAVGDRIASRGATASARRCVRIDAMTMLPSAAACSSMSPPFF